MPRNYVRYLLSLLASVCVCLFAYCSLVLGEGYKLQASLLHSVVTAITGFSRRRQAFVIFL